MFFRWKKMVLHDSPVMAVSEEEAQKSTTTCWKN